MPFESKAQMRAAFGGHLGSEMKAKAKEFARATPDIKKLPEKVKERSTDRMNRLIGGVSSVAKKNPAIRAGKAAAKAVGKVLQK